MIPRAIWVKTLILHLVADEDGIRAKERRLPTLPRYAAAHDAAPSANSSLSSRGLTRSRYPFVAQPAGRFLRDTRDISSAISSAITQTSFPG